MFSKELENLIQATLEDGVLEEYEKAALVKRATAEGVDLTELEIYINSILQKRQHELEEAKNAEYAKAEQQNIEAFGKTCPQCGKQVTPLTLVCDCGYEFTNQKELSSIRKLFEKLNSVELTKSEEKEVRKADDVKGARESYLVAKKVELISTFPVPNSKADIIDFLSMSISLANKKLGLGDKKNFFIVMAILASVTILGGLILMIIISEKSFAEEKLKKAWRAKFEQVLMKGRSLRGDAEFTQQLDYYENLLNKK